MTYVSYGLPHMYIIACGCHMPEPKFSSHGLDQWLSGRLLPMEIAAISVT
jgi:hypothetical protein